MTLPAKPQPQARLASYLPLRTVRLREAVSALQAAQSAPSLAGLTQMAEQSTRCLRLASAVIPASMHNAVQAGPLTPLTPLSQAGDVPNSSSARWCLIAANSSVAAKLRQLAPAIAAHLRTHGHNVQEISIKISVQTSK
jgi:hypothetical protein